MERTIITFIISILLMTCTNSSKEMELSYGVKKVVKKLIEYGEITGSFVGESGETPEQWHNFIEFREKATEKELLLLVERSNPIIKCYSFDILVRNDYQNIFDILKSNLTDSTSVYTQYGCIGSQVQVNDYFIYSVLKKKRDGYYYISDRKKSILDSLILNEKNINSQYKNDFLKDILPKKEYYNRIRELALNGNNSAIIGLAKFKNQNDVPLINDLLLDEDTDLQNFGLKAVKNFPSVKFWNSIKKIHLQEIKKSTSFDYAMIRGFYQALVQYKNIESRKLLEQTLNEATESAMRYHKEYIWVALKKYPDTIYNGIVQKMNFSEYELNNLEYIWDIYN